MYRDALTSEMKNAIKKAVAELLPILVARSLESDFSHGERSVDVDGEVLIVITMYADCHATWFVHENIVEHKFVFGKCKIPLIHVVVKFNPVEQQYWILVFTNAFINITVYSHFPVLFLI